MSHSPLQVRQTYGCCQSMTQCPSAVGDTPAQGVQSAEEAAAASPARCQSSSWNWAWPRGPGWGGPQPGGEGVLCPHLEQPGLFIRPGLTSCQVARRQMRQKPCDSLPPCLQTLKPHETLIKPSNRTQTLNPKP